MGSIYNQSLSSISFGNSVANQSKIWVNKSEVSDQINQQRVNANYMINSMSEQQSRIFWGNKTKNKDYLRLKIDHVHISKESSKNE